MLKAATGPRRKVLVHHARQLGQLAQMYQKLLASRTNLKKQLGSTVQGTEIKVWDTAYSGSVIRLGEYQRELVEEIKAARFHIREDKLVER